MSDRGHAIDGRGGEVPAFGAYLEGSAQAVSFSIFAAVARPYELGIKKSEPILQLTIGGVGALAGGTHTGLFLFL